MNARLIRLSICLILLQCVLAACDHKPKAPVIESVQPDSVAQGESLAVKIRGAFYLDARVSERNASHSRLGTTFSARLGEVELQDVKYLDFQQLTATVPPSLAIGIYDLSVEDPAGRVVTLNKAFTVTRREVQLTLEDAKDGLGTEIGDVDLRIGQVLALYAIGRRGDGSFVKNLQTNWTVLSEVGTLDNTVGTQALFTATSQGSGRIVGESDGYGSDQTGVISITSCTTDQQCADPCHSSSRCEQGSCIPGAVDKDTDADGLIDILCPGGSDCDDSNPNCTTDCTDIDGDGFCLPVDCDDTEQTGAFCNDGCSVFYQDVDGDLYGNSLSTTVACVCPAGYVEDNTDCADMPNRDVNCNGLGGEQCNPGFEGMDLCDGADNDCDASIDEDFVSTSTDCGQGACASTGLLSCIDGVETDDCTPGAQDEATDVTCDGLDGDCDGSIDEDWVASESCGQGVCLASEVCNGEAGPSCTPGEQFEATDVTCDGLDGDCDGSIDEDWVAGESCGQGVCLASEACNGEAGPSCTPGEPSEATDLTCDGLDGDCDGSIDEDWVAGTCGQGVCQAAEVCDAEEGPSCTPGSQDEATDVTCDGLDGDCDGFVDEDWVSGVTCGQGVCQADEVCNAEQGPSCTPGAQDEATDMTCDGLDGDCDGFVDEDYVIDDSCGVGYCYDNNTPSSCSDGVETPCQPAAPQTEGPEADPTCSDSIDNDCDSFTDIADTGCGANAPPVACFTVTPRTSDTDTAFAVDASCSSDDNTPLADLEVRWDWDSDGIYDTGWSKTKTELYTYATADVYEITVELRDSGDLFDWYTLAVNVADPNTTLTVTTNSNDIDPEVYGGPYTNGLSLREAIALANTRDGNDTITFSGAMTIELNLSQGLLDGNGVQIVGQPGVVVDGSNVTGISCFNVVGDDNTIMFLELTGCPGAAINIQAGSSGNAIRDCELYGNATAIKAMSAGNIIGPGNRIHDNTESDQVAMFASFVFTGNEIYNGVDSGLFVEDGVVGAVITLNLIHGNAGAGIQLLSQAVGADDAVITDNTIVDNGAEGIRFDGCKSTGAVVLNNIIANNGADGVASVCAENFAIGSPDYNDYWNNDGQDCSNCTPGDNSHFFDPLFMDEAAQDYRLQEGSPVIDQGTPSTNVDRNGHAPDLYWGLAPDMGRWESRQ